MLHWFRARAENAETGKTVKIEKKKHGGSGSGRENHTEYERRGSGVAEQGIVQIKTNTKNRWEGDLVRPRGGGLT